MNRMATAAVLFAASLAIGECVWSLIHEQQRDEDPLSCYEGRLRCLGDVTCKVLMETISKVCDESIHTCQTTQRLHCHSVLTALQSNLHFRNCNCNSTHDDVIECLQVHRTIFTHSCVKQSGFSSSVDQGSSSSSSSEGSESLLFVGEEMDVSCIGVRRDCLLTPKCNRLFNEFRNFCREGKRLSHCQTNEWKRCLGVLESLMQESSDLFHCTCPMKKPDIREKCERIRTRLSNNTCLATIPYIAYSSKFPEPSYDQMLSASEAYNRASTEHKHHHDDNSCPMAFRNCHLDEVCSSLLADFLSVCSWNISSSDCRRRECSDSIRKFVSLVRPEVVQSLVFCACAKSTAEDENCHVVQRGVVPACTSIEMPPPSCSDVIARCNQEPGCSERWASYQQHCAFDHQRSVAGVAGAAAAAAERCPAAAESSCVRSVVEVFGTVLTVNCSCSSPSSPSSSPSSSSSVDFDRGSSVFCRDAQTKLQQLAVCRETAAVNFHHKSQTISSSAVSIGGGFTSSVDQRELPLEDTFYAKPSDTGHATAIDPGCRRHVGLKIPSFMTTPSVIRIYHNVTDCSDLCHCHMNNTVTCRTLPCSPNLSCRHKDTQYGHGEAFMLLDRGQCRCIKAEMICAKAHFQMQPKIGLFIHIGYSMVEQYLIEGHSSVNFQLDRLKSKLSALLNEDSAEQFCSLSLHQSYEGNLIFEIGISKFSRKSRTLQSSEICMTSAKALSHMINARHWTIITDPELSLLKVSQLERVRFHEQSAKEERKGGWSTSSSSRTSSSSSCFLLLLLLLLLTGSTKSSPHRCRRWRLFLLLLLLEAIGPHFVAASIGSLLLFGRFHLLLLLSSLLFCSTNIKGP